MKGLRDGKAGLWLAALMAAAALMLTLQNTNGTENRTERRMAEVLGAMAGAGRVEVALFYENAQESGVPTGAVVVAEGAEDLSVRLSLIRAVRTLLGLSENAVDVFEMEDGRR